MKILFIIILPLLLITSSFASSGKGNVITTETKDSVFAEYRYVTPDKDGMIVILLKKDKTYEYSFANHIQSFCSKGKWEIKKDTLILNSFIQKDDLPITIKADSINNSSEYAQIDLIRYRNGDVVNGAQVLINGDTSKHCMPAFENDCKIKSNELKSVQIRIGDNISSKWQSIKLPNANHLAITINLDFFIECYCYTFFKKEKFIIVGKKLYPTEQTSSEKKGKLIRSKRYFLTKGVYPPRDALRRNGCG